MQATQALKNCEKIYNILNRFARKFTFFKQDIRALKLWTISFHFLDWSGSPNNLFFKQAFWSIEFSNILLRFLEWISLRRVCVFQASNLSFGKLKEINSFQILHRFAKILSFFCKQFNLWNSPNGCLDKTSFGKNLISQTSYESFKNFEIIQVCL